MLSVQIFAYAIRPCLIRPKRLTTLHVANIIVQCLFNALIVRFVGWSALRYMYFLYKILIFFVVQIKKKFYDYMARSTWTDNEDIVLIHACQITCIHAHFLLYQEEQTEQTELSLETHFCISF